MKNRTGFLLLLAFLLGLVLPAHSQTDTTRKDTAKKVTTSPPVPPPVQAEGHSSAYCGLFEMQCRKEMALKANRDSLARLVETLRKSSGCDSSCRATMKSLNDRIAAQDDSISKLRQSNIAARTELANRPVIVRPSASAAGRSSVAGITSPTLTLPVSQKDAPRQIARVDTVRIVRYDTTTRTVTDTVLRVDTLWRERFIQPQPVVVEQRGFNWKPWVTTGLLAAAACPVYGMIKSRDWRKPYCVGVRQSVDIR